MADVQAIYSDNPGALANAVYTIPPGLDLELTSVRARVSGSGAAASFIVVCEVLTQDGRLLAQSPIDQTLAVGDTGAFTWAPFLRQAAAAAAPSSDARPWARLERRFADANQSIGNNSFTNVDMTTAVNVGAGESGNGVFTADTAANTLTLVSAGVVLVRAYAQWFDAITNDWQVWVSNNRTAQHNENRYAGGTAVTMTGELDFLARASAGTAFRAGVWQHDGAARNLDAAFLELTYFGTYTGTEFASLDPDVA